MSDGVGLRAMARFRIFHSSGIDFPWKLLPAEINGGREAPWNLNPDYQRGPVWTREQQCRYIGHHLIGGMVGPIIVNRDDETWEREVIDGQQRTRAILAFLAGEIPATPIVDGEWRSFYWGDMSSREQNDMLASSKITYIYLPRPERLRYYLFLNSGGTPHTASDLKKVADLLAAEAATPK